ncbi:hypothetical protein BGW80DRAFT_1187234 [Lactifluus volemus]|nr:hypothetical protein BGW80DRAFT_1187234 [Lactifluus volemus]
MSSGSHGFKQWIGNDSKALIKVYLPAIKEYIPDNMVCMLCAFLNFCYLAWHNILNLESLSQLHEALHLFHHHHTVFKTAGVCSKGHIPPTSTLWNTTQKPSMISWHSMVCAHQSQNQNTSRL